MQNEIIEEKIKRKYTMKIRKPKIINLNPNKVGRPKIDKPIKEKKSVGRPRVEKLPKPPKIPKEKKIYTEEEKKLKIAGYQKKWYMKNKTKYISDILEKEMCECGTKYSKVHKNRHLRSRLHEKRLNIILDPTITETESLNKI